MQQRGGARERLTRTARRLRPLWVGVSALAVVTAGLGPAAAATGEPAAPSGLWVNSEECGPEPLSTTIASADTGSLPLEATFGDPAPTTARFEVLRADGTVALDQDFDLEQDGRVSRVVRLARAGLVEGSTYTFRVRARGADGADGAALQCDFAFDQGPAKPTTVPVLGEPAVYPSDQAGGGVGARGAFVVLPGDDETVAYDYGFTQEYDGFPERTTRIAAAEAGPTVIPFVPAVEGDQYLKVAPVDAAGLQGGRTSRTIRVAAGAPVRPAPAVTVVEPKDSVPGDGRLPLELTVSSAVAWDLSRLDGEFVLRYRGVELARVPAAAATERVMVDEAALGTGFRDLQVEYRQFAGATPVVSTARVCGGSCSFGGGKVSVGSDTGKVSVTTDLTARVSAFSPAPASYTYQWLRDGKAIKGATTKDYLGVPTDQGHRLSVKVTAHGPRMEPRSVTSSPVLVGDRDEIHAVYGVRSIGNRWVKYLDFREFRDGATAGVVGGGRSVELLAASFYSRAYDIALSPSDDVPLWFDMTGYVQGRGWTDLKRRDSMDYVGSIGEKRRLEAIRIDTAGPVSPYYDVFYRVYVPGRGWLGWATNGGTSGTIGYGSRIEGVQIKVLPHGKTPTASGTGNAPSYSRSTQKQVHVEAFMDPGKVWRVPMGGGSTAGRADSVSAPQRLNALRVDLDGRYSGSVQVSAKVKGDGWRAYVGDDRTAGSTGYGLPTSAYRMRLTGSMADHYRLYYRTYVQGVGWLGWAHDGAASGTSSYTPRPTAVQVLLVPKGEAAPRSGYGRAAYRS